MESKEQEVMYIVMGTTGEYSDRTEWPVHAYNEKSRAEQHVLDAEEFARINGLSNGDLDYEERDTLAKLNPFDPNMRVDYTGTSYYMIEVPFTSIELSNDKSTSRVTMVGGKLKV